MARVIIYEADNPVPQWNAFALEHLSVILRKVYFSKAELYQPYDQQAVKVLKDLLEDGSDRPYPEADLFPYSVSDHSSVFQMIVIQVSAEDINNQTAHYFEIQLSHEFADSLAVWYMERLVLLARFPDNGRAVYDFRKRFNILIRDSNFRTGMSNLIQDISQIRGGYLQALIALQYGLQRDPTKWIHLFRDYVMSYLLDKCREELPADLLRDPRLLKLRDYDAENDTELYHTLEVYLQNDQNAVRSAKQLYIQRNTLLYRLKRIREIAEIDLREENDLAYLRLSYLL